MQNRPEWIRKSAWIAFFLEAGYILCKMLLIFIIPAFSPEISISLTGILFLLASDCCMLPFAGVCLWNAKHGDRTRNQTIVTLVLAAVCYTFDGIAGTVLRFLMFRILSLFESMENIAYANQIEAYRNMLSILPVRQAALVLICCAAAVELYILNHEQTNQEKIN